MGKVRRKVLRKVRRKVKRLRIKKSEVRRGVNSFMLVHREYFDGKRVIDFGSGESMQYKNFYDYGEYIPLDKELNGVDICKKMDVKGDCGICVAVLEHCMDPVSALKNIRDCIEEGYLLLAVSIKYVLHMLPDDYYRFTQEFWRVVESCGFEIVEKSEILGKGLDGQDSSMLTMLCKGK